MNKSWGSLKWANVALALCAVVLAAGAAVLFDAGAANAALNNCNNDTHNVQAVGIVDPSGAGGDRIYRAQANVEVMFTDVCSQNGNGSASGWVMVNGQENSNDGWAQVGFARDEGVDHPRYFWQWVENNCGSSCTTYTYKWGSPAKQSVHNFKVSRYASDGRLHMLLDNNATPCQMTLVCGVTDFDPELAWRDMQAQIGGEVGQKESDIPGDTGSGHDTYSDITESKISDGDVWSPHTLVVSPGPPQCYFFVAKDSDSVEHTWTQPLDHSC